MNPTRPLDIKTELLPLSLVRAFWKHRFLAVATALALGGAASVAISKLPSVYRSEAVVFVDTPKISERFVASTVNSQVDDRLNWLTREVMSGDHVQKIVEELDLYPELKPRTLNVVIAKVRADTEITFDRGWSNARTGAFRVAYKGPNPKIVADVANRLANFFIKENMRVREGEAEGTSEFIETQLREAKAKLDELEAEISRYKIQHNGELPQQENALSAAVGRQQLDLQGNRDAIGRAEQSKALLLDTLRAAEAYEVILMRPGVRRAPVAAGEPDSATNFSAPDPPKRSERLAVQLETLLHRYGDEHPEIRHLRAELAATREKERADAAKQEEAPQRATKSLSSPASQSAGKDARDDDPSLNAEVLRAKERTAQLRLQLSLLEKEIRTRTANGEGIQHEINSYQRRIEGLPIREQELSRLTRDYEISKGNYTSLLAKKLSAEMGTDMEKHQQAEKFTLFAAAKVPTTPFAPNRRLYLAVAWVASVLFGMTIAIAKELKSNVLLGEWELAQEPPILGRVPSIKAMEPGRSGDRGRRRLTFRRGAAASLVLSILGVIAAGFYLSARRF